MKLIGCILVAAGAALCYLGGRSAARRELGWGRQLLADLALLRREVCVVRRPLPDILVTELTVGRSTARAWQALLEALPQGFDTAWKRFQESVPPSFAPASMSLGEHLRAGGDELAGAIDETREELARYLHERRQREAEQARLEGALCFSGAALLILVLI